MNKTYTLRPVSPGEPVHRILVDGDICPQGRSEAVLAGDNASDFWNGISSTMSQHDICIVNLECPLTESIHPIIKGGPHFHAHPLCPWGIRCGGFAKANLANNYFVDMGKQGLEDTLKALHLH